MTFTDYAFVEHTQFTLYFNIFTVYKVAESTNIALYLKVHFCGIVGLTIRNGKMNPSMVNPSQRSKPVNTNAAGRYDWMKISLASDGAIPAVWSKKV